MTEFQLTTDVGTAVATAASDADDIQILVNGEIPETYSGLRTDTAKECVDGVIALSPEYNTYVVAPAAGDTISFDAGDIPGCRFKLLLDCSAGAVSFSLADNFKWTGAAPAMTDKGVHGVDVVYVSVNGISAFLGTYLGVVLKSLDPNRGVVTYLNGERKEGWCGEEFNSLTIEARGWDEDYNELNETVIVDINPGSNITGELTLNSYEQSALTVNVKGGVVSRIASQVPDGTLAFNMTSGVVHDVYWTSSGLGPVAFSMNGGTIGNLTISDMDGTGISISGGAVDRMLLNIIFTSDATISGGTIGSCIVDIDAHLHVSAGTVGSISLTEQTATVNVSGGYVGLIETTTFKDGVDDINLSGCTVGRLIAYINAMYDPVAVIGDNVTIGELRMHQNSNNMAQASFAPNIGSNCTIERLSFAHNYDIVEDVSTFSFSVGANSVVKLDRTMQELVALGKATINADPTAQIIDLED